MRSDYVRKFITTDKLKENITNYLDGIVECPLGIIKEGAIVAYLLSPECFESLLSSFEDAELEKIVQERLDDGEKNINLDLNKL